MSTFWFCVVCLCSSSVLPVLCILCSSIVSRCSALLSGVVERNRQSLSRSSFSILSSSDVMFADVDTCGSKAWFGFCKLSSFPNRTGGVAWRCLLRVFIPVSGFSPLSRGKTPRCLGDVRVLPFAPFALPRVLRTMSKLRKRMER